MHPTSHPRLLAVTLTALGTVTFLGTAFAGTATAKAHEAHTAKSSHTVAYTEDNDTNDGGAPNNVADDGDNRHPSGKDRSVEHGGSGTQGRSTSDPDNDGKGPDRNSGGPDKPNGSGGLDKADQDGNNGCGNDDDFEDDNEGWCGRHPKKERAAEVTPEKETPEVKSDVDSESGSDETPAADVLGLTLVQPSVLAAKAVTPATVTPSAEVLAASAERPVLADVAPAAAVHAASAGSALAFTGLDAVTLLLLAVGALVIGGLFLAMARSRTA